MLYYQTFCAHLIKNNDNPKIIELNITSNLNAVQN